MDHFDHRFRSARATPSLTPSSRRKGRNYFYAKTERGEVFHTAEERYYYQAVHRDKRATVKITSDLTLSRFLLIARMNL